MTQKLTVALKRAGTTSADLKKIVKQFKKLTVHVVGDLIVDKYTQSYFLGSSSTTAALTVQKGDSTLYVGAAGIVSKHLSSLGAKVTLTTVVGDDEVARYAIKDLKSFGVRVNAILDHERPTTIYQRFVLDSGQNVFEVVTTNNKDINQTILKKLCTIIRKIKSDIVICSDFRRGIFSPVTSQKIISSIPENVLRIADSQVSDRWGNILEFQNFDFIKPNQKETRFALHHQEIAIGQAAEILYQKSGTQFLIITMAEEGILVKNKTKQLLLNRL